MTMCDTLCNLYKFKIENQERYVTYLIHLKTDYLSYSLYEAVL